MTMQVDGIVTGFDTSSMIDGIVNASAIPGKVMESQLDELGERREKVAGLANRLEDLSSTLGNLGTEQDIVALSASVSDTTQLSVSTSSDAVTGTWDVQVKRLATAELELSQGFSDATSTDVIEEGTYTVTYGTDSTEITIDSANSSLTNLADQIDEIDGLTAFVLNTGEPSDPYRLVIQGEDTGAENAISVSVAGASGPGTAVAWTEFQGADDAWIQVNGIDVYSASNTASDVLPGVSLQLQAVGDEPTSVTLSRDNDAIYANIEQFVEGFNTVTSYYDTHTAYDSEKNIKGALIGDATARRVMDTLGSLVSSAYDVGGLYSSLGEIGIETQQDGSLKVDSDKLQTAIEDNLDDVVALFTTEGGPAETLRTKIDDVFVDEDSGSLTTREESLQTSIEELGERITDFNEYLSDMADRLRGRFTDLEVAMSSFQSTQTYLTSLFSS